MWASIAPAAPAGVEVESGPARFAAAKLLALEGSFPEAIAAFESAIAAGPDDAYLRLELASVLARMGSYSRGAARLEHLRRAAAEADLARALAPDNPDILRLVGQIGMTLAAEDPASADSARGAFETLRQQRPDDPQALLALGQLQMTQNDFAAAAVNFRQATQLRPDQRVAFALLVEALFRSGQEDEALSALTDLVRRFPDAAEQRIRLARMLEERGKHQEALAALADAPGAQSGDPEILRTKALIEYQAGDLTAALATLDRALADPEGVDEERGSARYLRALVLASLARNDEAAIELEGLRVRAPDSADLARMLARVRERQGDWREAARILSDAVAKLAAHEGPEAAAETVALRLEWAGTLSRAEAWTDAAAVLEPLLTSGDPEIREQAALARAEAQYRGGDLEGALRGLESHSSPASQAKRAELLLRADRPADAKQILTEIGGQGVDGLLLAAEAFQRAEEYGEAVPWLERAVAAAPDAPEPSFHLAAAYERLGRREEAVGVFEKLLERLPDFAPALNYLGYMFAERGERLPEAVQLTLRALRLDPDNGAYADSVGWAYFQHGDLNRAREYLERAAGLIPADATILEHLGDLYVARGEAAKARETYQRALQLNEDNAAAVGRKLQGLRNRS